MSIDGHARPARSTCHFILIAIMWYSQQNSIEIKLWNKAGLFKTHENSTSGARPAAAASRDSVPLSDQNEREEFCARIEIAGDCLNVCRRRGS
eukprot:COSAG03_NODE_12647_length_537_cov_27.671384_1_plen_93_part_00